LFQYSKNIRRLLAACFLLLFSFCITPKRFLHELLANHRDAEISANQPVQQITSLGFHCHCDDLVVVAPFLPEIQAAATVALSFVPVRYTEPVAAFIVTGHAPADSRGPPEFSIS